MDSGAMFGSMIGSAIGGIAGGHRGSDIGMLVGMAGGAAVGAAIGKANERAREEKYEAYRREHGERAARRGQSRYGTGSGYDADDSGFDPTNGGDDRITFDPVSSSSDGPYIVASDSIHIGTAAGERHRSVPFERLRQGMGGGTDTLRHAVRVEISNVEFSDADGDGVISRGETCRVTFEIMNRSAVPLHNVLPFVTDSTANKHITISPAVRVEVIAPGRGVRYSAAVAADKRLKDGEIVLRVGAADGDDAKPLQSVDLRIVTRKKALPAG